MRKITIVCFAMILLSVAQANAQSLGTVPSPGTTRQQARAIRQSEIRRQNYAKQEAIRLLFGPQGIPALTRPSDPWNSNRPRFFYAQPNSFRNRYPVYYR